MMARLSATDRAKLPDSAFAYVDSKGRRKLPINDEAHVRNALARFERVAFETDAARERTRKRLLKAAKKYGIVPVGFIDGQLESELLRGQAQGRSFEGAGLPTGVVSFLMTDIEDSTALLRRLGDRYAELLRDVRTILRRAVVRAGGHEVDSRADEFFAAFERPEAAVEAAVAIQRALERRSWWDGVECRVRAGIHTGEATLNETGYIGISVHTAARICAGAHGGQIVVSEQTRAAVEASATPNVGFVSLGRHRLAGLPQTQELFQVEGRGLRTEFPPLRATGSRAATRRRSVEP
jgi:class 3 adenylate cyclase